MSRMDMLSVPLPKNEACCANLRRPTVIGMVGLPARGKSYIANKLERYLTWSGINTHIFNLGNYRRELEPHSASNNFFCGKNTGGKALREMCAKLAIDHAIQFLREECGDVAIVDATNSTIERRNLLKKRFVNEHGFHLFFLESVCDDQAVIHDNIMDVKVGGPDYPGQDPESVVQDFLQRIHHYNQEYKTLGSDGEDPSLPFIRTINKGEKFVVNQPLLGGPILPRVSRYMMQDRVISRTIYLVQSGEPTEERDNLTTYGWQFAENLTRWLNRDEGEEKEEGVMARSAAVSCPLHVLASDCRPCGLTADVLCEGRPQMSLRIFPALQYRGHKDLAARLDPVVMAVEESDGDVVIIGQHAVLQNLLGYFLGKDAAHTQRTFPSDHSAAVHLSPTSYGHSAKVVQIL